MANEITIQVAMSRKDPANPADDHFFPATIIRANQTLMRKSDQDYPYTTSESEVTFPTITTNGWFMARNKSLTASVDWGVATGAYTGTMMPGETAGPFRLKTGKTIFLDGTAAGDVRLILYGA